MKKFMLVIIGLVALATSVCATTGLVDLSFIGFASSGLTLLVAPLFSMSNNLTPSEKAQILEVVRENMSFEGDTNFYDGGDDDFVCFDGSPNASFLTEATAVYRQFIMTISNKGETAQQVLLTPGLLWSPSSLDANRFLSNLRPITEVNPDEFGAGIPAAEVMLKGDMTPNEGAVLTADGWVMDGLFYAINDNMYTVSPVLTGSGSPKTIKEFHAFIANNPTNLLGMRISSNGDDGVQTGYQLQVLSQSPFRDLESKVLNPATYLDQNTYQKDIVLFNTNGLTLGNQTQLKYTIAPRVSADVARQVSITFICGAVLNTTSALNKKQGKAVRNFGSLVQKSNMFKVK